MGCVLLGVSCSGDKVSTLSQDEITLAPATEPVTRAAITGTDMPDGFHIWLSTYLSDVTSPANNRNYFTNVEYAKDGSEWKSATPYYWPLQGTLDFLGIATDPALGITCTWNAARNASRVDVDVPDTYASQTEVLCCFLPAGRCSCERAHVILSQSGFALIQVSCKYPESDKGDGHYNPRCLY